MKALRLLPLIASVILVLAPFDAQAVDGTITGLTLNPNPANANQNVDITVTGTQKCKKVSVDFGDNTPPEILNNPDFENNNTADDTVTHTYGGDGNYLVVASPVEQCSGGAQKSLTVGAGGGNGGGTIKPGILGSKDLLCKILDNCPGVKLSPGIAKIAASMFPKLEGIFPFSVIEPSGDVIVTGKSFGSTKGELHLYLKTDNRDIKLTVDTWGPSGIGARIPWGTFGVVDQQGEFYVKTAAGFKSNRKGPVSFTARRAVKPLPRSDVKLGFLGCGNKADCNYCKASNWWLNNDSCFVGGSSQGTVTGYHWQHCGLIGNDVDNDTFVLKAPLKNGWVLDKAYIHTTVDPGEGSASASLTSNGVKVNWSISPCDGIGYYVTVVIKGPTGIDH